MKFKLKISGTIEQASVVYRCVLLFFIFATCSQASIPNFTQADIAYSGDHRVEVYTHGPDLSGTLGGAGGISGILADFRPQTSDLRFFHADAMGNVVLTTDSSGDITSTHRYTPFGRPITSTGSYQPRFGYSSKEYDSETGLNYYGYRYLAVNQGRWLNRDPIGEAGGLNLYQFVRNSATRYLDPFGLKKAVYVSRAPWSDRLTWELDKEEVAKIESLNAYIICVQNSKSGNDVDKARIVDAAQAYISAIRNWKPTHPRPANGAVLTFPFAQYEGTEPEWKRLVRAAQAGFCCGVAAGLSAEFATALFSGDGIGDPMDDYPRNADDWTPPDGWTETSSGEKTYGRHRQWRDENGEIVRRWDAEGADNQPGLGPHWADSRYPDEHLEPNR